jgi:hypothetical protein
MLEWLFSWEVTSVVSVALAGFGFAVLALDDFKLAKLFFLIGAADASGGVVMWGIKADSPMWQVAIVVFVVVGTIASLTVIFFRYVDDKRSAKETSQQEDHRSPSTIPTPSLLFVFGVPLGDNDSAQWLMIIKHFGPSLAHRCDIIFYDDDRKNIEHEWLVKNPNIPYPPQGLAGVSGKRIFVPEAGPEGSLGSFKWNPVNPNSQHYTVSIDCRDGYFTEKWLVTRVNGVLRSSITIEHGSQWVEKNPGLDPVVFRYQDPEFIQTALATEMPKVQQGKVVHPGWKSLHRFEVPAAIIDPNGNIEVVSGVKLPDDSTQTDFGSWNILTRHFGDNPTPPKQP